MKLQCTAITNANAVQVMNDGTAAIRAGDASIDLGAVRSCDTAAVACVLGWLRAARAAGRELELVALPPPLLSLAQLYGVEALVSGAQRPPVPH